MGTVHLLVTCGNEIFLVLIFRTLCFFFSFLLPWLCLLLFFLYYMWKVTPFELFTKMKCFWEKNFNGCCSSTHWSLHGGDRIYLSIFKVLVFICWNHCTCFKERKDRNSHFVLFLHPKKSFVFARSIWELGELKTGGQPCDIDSGDRKPAGRGEACWETALEVCMRNSAWSTSTAEKERHFKEVSVYAMNHTSCSSRDQFSSEVCFMFSGCSFQYCAVYSLSQMQLCIIVYCVMVCISVHLFINFLK